MYFLVKFELQICPYLGRCTNEEQTRLVKAETAAEAIVKLNKYFDDLSEPYGGTTYSVFSESVLPTIE